MTSVMVEISGSVWEQADKSVSTTCHLFFSGLFFKTQNHEDALWQRSPEIHRLFRWTYQM